MATAIDNTPLGLVRLFSDFSLLGDLFVRPYGEWPKFLGDLGANRDNIKDSDLPPGDVHEQMARDVMQLGRRIGLLEDPPTEAGRAIAGIGNVARESRTPDHYRLLSETLATQIRAHYRGHNGVPLTDLLQDAAIEVAHVSGNWEGYSPGLLLGEFRRLIPLAHADAQEARRLVEDLPRIREQVVEAAGMDSPDQQLTHLQNIVAYADAINAHHLNEIAKAEQEGLPTITQTEARTTAILLTYAGLLAHEHILGPVHCLGAPVPDDTRPQPSPTDPAPLILGDGSVWDVGLQAGLVAILMMYLMNDEFTVDDRVVFPTLGIDMASRADADNVGSTSPREIAEHRKINKGLAMELLTGLLLARLDSASAVHCNCDTRHGLPHAVAGGGLTDVEAIYEASGTTPRFRVIAAVSAKSDVTRAFYLKQLEQALRHGRQIAERTGVPVYALVLNGGDIGSDTDLLEVFQTFVASEGLGRGGPVRVVPMYAPSLASAVRELEVNLAPDAFRFRADVLADVFETVLDGLLAPPEEKRPADWVRKTWTQVVSGEPRRRAPRGPQP